MTFDTAFERSHPPNVTINEKDRVEAQRIVREWAEHDTNEHYNSDYLREEFGAEHLEGRIMAALTTARKDARAAAFKKARQAIDNMDVVITRFQKRSSDYNGWNSAIKQAHKALQAAANTEEGAGDG